MWISKFLTVEGASVCTHEASEFAGSPEEFWDNAEKYATGVDIYGNSDSANIFVIPSLLAIKPLTRVVWIDRPIDEVARSMEVVGIPFNDKALHNLMSMHDLYEDYFDLIIRFDDLKSGEVCKALWEFCLPGVPFDWGRWGLLDSQKLCYSKENPMPPKYFQRFLAWVQRDRKSVV